MLQVLKANDTLGRIKKQIYDLAIYNSTPERGVTRVVYTEEDRKAKGYLKEYMIGIGLEVHEDAIGNIFGKLKGTNSNLAPIWSGSHVDAPLNSGMFDGVVGVLGAIEALRIIKEKGLTHKRDLVAVVFASEEPTRFGIGCLGSRAMAGKLPDSYLRELCDKEGVSLYEAMKSSGYDPTKIQEVRVNKGQVGMFIELHIEQGPVLESIGKPIGLVNVIAAPTEIVLTLEGEQRHAGSTPMNLRKDPVPAAAEIILALEEWAKKSKTPHTVCTVGQIEVIPGTSNVIANKVRLTIDSRDVDKANKQYFRSFIHEIISDICAKRQISYQLELKTHDAPATADKSILETCKEACNELAVDYHIMASGAYHDAMIMSTIAPFGMIFIPSRNGISHDEKEWTDFNQIEVGVQVLANTLYKLANN